MSGPDRIIAKLEQCGDIRRELAELTARLDAGDEDWVVWRAIERTLQVAIECALEVGEMVISWKRLTQAKGYREVFAVLGEAGLLDRTLAERLEDAAGLRNLLVHGYGIVDRERLREVLATDVDDLDAFAKQVAALVA